MARGRPWHVPAVGTVALLFMALSAADYLLVRFEVAAYLALFPEAQVRYFTGLPFWLGFLWAVAVWSGLAGAVCLLAGSRGAAVFLGVGAAAMVLATAGFLVLTDPPMYAVTGPVGVWIMVGSSAVFAVLWLYARRMHAIGYLP